ncbi:MAG TPA: phosphatase PAP2 family protein [Kofleriaceae bacterium]|nr:phosphatase PAP2 family protein [Kofleriaceae bacterium]
METRARRALGPACAALAVACAAGPARAGQGEGAAAAGPPLAARGSGGELELDWRLHAAVVVVGGIGWIASEALLKDELAPDECRWCGGNGLDDTVRGWLRWDDTGAAHGASDLVAFGLAPAGAFGLTALAAWRDDRARDWPIDALIVLESVVLAADLNQLTKFAVGRARPFVRAGGAGVADDPDNNLSFYSGHTSLAFSLATSAGAVATIRGYRAAPLVWGAGLTLAAATGWLRIAADKHYATDVLTGAAIGSAIGLAVPLLLRRAPGGERAPRVGVAPLPGGGLVSAGLRW